jgi:hypothetical protein
MEVYDMNNEIKFTRIGNKVVCNTTPHDICFDVDGAVVVVPKSGIILNAKPEEIQVSDDLVETRFVGTDEGRALIDEIKAAHAASADAECKLRIVGSIIAAQAYPGKVVAMTPAPGFERVPPAEKRMNPNKFTVYLR